MSISRCSGINHAWTLVLFTLSDFKTIVFPSLIFALFSAFHFKPDIGLREMLLSTPKTTFWIWMNLLAFCIHNQSSPSAIEEDRRNKPWRPLPSGRLDLQRSHVLQRFVYFGVIILAAFLGGFRQTVFLVFLNLCYNQWGGADASVLSRSLLNCLGLSTYNSGALEVLSGSPALVESRDVLEWQGIIALLILTTIHVQDFEDLEGDLARGRTTLPIWLGDHTARSWTAITLAFWALAGPAWWNAGYASWALIWAFAGGILKCLLPHKGLRGDKRAFQLWCSWLLCFYALPVIS